jgi:RNA polymerase sigma-70 factor, ECF subfamily
MPLLANDPRDRTVRFEAFERDYVLAVARKVLKDDDAAADVAQDALLNAFRHRASFRGDSRFTTWLYKVTVTTALMYLRKQRRAPAKLNRLEIGHADLDLVASGPSPEDQTAAREAVALAERCLAELGARYHTVCRMRFAEGYSETEIARDLGVAVNTVKTRAFRARVILRRELGSTTRRSA